MFCLSQYSDVSTTMLYCTAFIMAPVCITLSQHLPFRGVFILKMGNTCLSTPLLRLTYWGFVVSDLRQNEMSDMTALNHYLIGYWLTMTLQWRHNGRNSVSNHQLYDCLLNRFIQAQIKENIKAPRHWTLCGEFTGTGEFPAQMASNAENVSIWWRHHE